MKDTAYERRRGGKMNRNNPDLILSLEMNGCCKDFFDKEGLQGERNEPMQFCPYCGRQLRNKEFEYYNQKLGGLKNE